MASHTYVNRVELFLLEQWVQVWYLLDDWKKDAVDGTRHLFCFCPTPQPQRHAPPAGGAIDYTDHILEFKY